MPEFKLPEIGEGVIEGEIVRWIVQPGQSVEANEALVEVMTDKATIEVPSPLAGTVTELRAAEGDICSVGAVIAIIDDASQGEAHAPPRAERGPRPSGTNGEILATPAARALARKEGLDLAAIDSDGARITKTDVIAAAQRGPTIAPANTPAPRPVPVVDEAPPATHTPAAQPLPANTTSANTPTPATAARAAPLSAPVARTAPTNRVDERIPFRGLRRKIAESIHTSYSSAAHYTYVEQIDVTRLVDLRKQAKKAAAESGVNLSYLPFIIKAVVHGLRRFPIVNAHLDTERSEIVLHKRYHIGVAAATEQGLMVPVVRDADGLSLLDLAREVKRLGDGAKAGQLARDELSGSTFSITSLGSIGGVLATPILNFPEVGILGVHAIRKTPIVGENDQIVIGHLMNLSVSLDHRIVDGFEGASFLQEVKRYLEDPTLLLLSGI
jgi:pyruvate dehydrogenase E2 component (dihydrolipoamide acetyltransferase)